MRGATLRVDHLEADSYLLRMRVLMVLLALGIFGCQAEPMNPPLQTSTSARIRPSSPPPPPPPPASPRNDVHGGVSPRDSQKFTYPIEPPPHPDDPVARPTLPPVLIKRVEPELTEEARKARISGLVILEIVIERDGRVGGGQVLKPLPMGLTQKAIEAVEQWKYEPAVHKGLPVRTKEIVRIAFRPE